MQTERFDVRGCEAAGDGGHSYQSPHEDVRRRTRNFKVRDTKSTRSAILAWHVKNTDTATRFGVYG